MIGTQPVREALRAHGAKVERVLLQANNPRLSGLREFALSLGVPVQELPGRELDRLEPDGRHQGAMAFAPPLHLGPLPRATRASLVLALDGVQDPQNFGAAVRSAVGVANAPVLWAENASAPLSTATFRASAGAIEHAELCRVPSLGQALFEAQADGYRVVALDAHAQTALWSVDLTLPTILVVGGEGRGLGRSVRRACTDFARLVLPRTIDSLNASVAAALALYEAIAQRQRRAIDSASEPVPALPER